MTSDVKNSLKAAVFTGVFTFLSTISIALLGFLTSLTEFINGDDPVIADDVNALGKVVLAAVVAFFASLVNWLYRFAQAKGAPLPGSKPAYDAIEVDLVDDGV